MKNFLILCNFSIISNIRSKNKNFNIFVKRLTLLNEKSKNEHQEKLKSSIKLPKLKKVD